MRYSVRAAAIRSGGGLAGDAVRGLRVGRLRRSAGLLFLLRLLHLLVLIGIGTGGRAVAAEAGTVLAAAAEENANHSDAEETRESSHA